MLDTLAYFLPLGIYLFVIFLSAVLPGKWVNGYAINPQTNQPYRYRLNGKTVYFMILGIWAFTCYQKWVPWDLFYQVRWQTAIGACITGLLVSAWIVFSAPRKPGSSLGQDFYLGRLDNPQWRQGKLDMKLCLYLSGAVMLILNTLSFAAHHCIMYPDHISSGVILYTLLFSFFVTEYVIFENVHLYTYDFLAEKVGFKLAWGCLSFYPFFYQVGLWSAAELPDPNSSPNYLIGCAVVFFMGWILARGANLQKFSFKKDPNQNFLGFFEQRAMTSDQGKSLLINGFWGFSRHVNYLGEILMAVGLALSLGYPTFWAPWLYPVYYIFLLFPRQKDDDRRCKAKYGSLWEEYCTQVPYKIIPLIY